MSIEDDIIFIERVPTLRMLGRDALRILAIGAESRYVHKGEVLFLAGIRPTTLSSDISKPRTVLLHRAIQQVLTQAVTNGGSTLRDFTNAQGEAGHFQLEARVYNRAGLPCHVCGTPVKSIRQGQRSTFYCLRCQKP